MTERTHTLTNPVIGHRVTFLQTAAQTNGQLLQVEYVVAHPESAPTIPLHVHLHTHERFETVRGRLGLHLNGSTSYLLPGQDVTIPPGAPHTFWNAGPGELRFLTDVRPPGGFQTYWETVFRLAAAGKVGPNGLPSLLQLALLAPLADSYEPRLPVSLSKVLVAALGDLARTLGYRAQYEHSGGYDDAAIPGV